MAKKVIPDTMVNELSGGSSLFTRSPAPKPLPKASPEASRQTKNPKVVSNTSKEVKAVVKKFTSKIINDPKDPAVNKVGYYFSWREIERLDATITKLKPIMRRKGIKITKNEIIRACLVIGLKDWDENQMAGELVNLLVKK